MNTFQRRILYLYACLIGVMVVFPPTIYTETKPNLYSDSASMQTTSGSGGFRFIGSLASGSITYGWNYSYSVNAVQLMIQIVAISLVAAALCLALKKKEGIMPKAVEPAGTSGTPPVDAGDRASGAPGSPSTFGNSRTDTLNMDTQNRNNPKKRSLGLMFLFIWGALLAAKTLGAIVGGNATLRFFVANAVMYAIVAGIVVGGIATFRGGK